MTTANGTSSLVAALLITYGDVSLRQLVLAFAMVQVVSGILWVLCLLYTSPSPRDRG